MNVRAEPLCGLFIVGRAIFCGIACDQPFVKTATYFEKTFSIDFVFASAPVATNRTDRVLTFDPYFVGKSIKRKGFMIGQQSMHVLVDRNGIRSEESTPR